jgi:hypothetical protein
LRVCSDAFQAASSAASCERRHKARGKNLADTVVSLIANVHVPKGIHGNAVGPIKRGCCTYAIRKGRASRASVRCDHARGADSTYAVVANVSNIHA